MKFTRACSVFAFLLAVKLLTPECQCDHVVHKKPHVNNNHSHGSGNCGASHGNSSANSGKSGNSGISGNVGNSGCSNVVSGNSSNSVNIPVSGASVSSPKLSVPGTTPPPAPTPSPVKPSPKDDAGKAIDQIDDQIEKKNKKKKLCIISSAATALALLLGGALGLGIYKKRKAPKVNAENTNDAPAADSSEPVVEGNTETPAATDAPTNPETPQES
ncbi:Early transcribed membrane protein [Plasmodium coatneyi]|uniref:Early transcribed membrane protein n=1 Tax=Plasmodium coatneyi TaxID=208452 RepID=A0A1B1DTV0_9APIC|nr:Early transcribed membrane protein [Plasmodium coatneyi]ANQ06182.1 Early transcribed membrane protein [Plasmodium coatneyi]